MKIKVIKESKDGTTEFTANLNEAQHKFLLEFAVQELLRRGLSVPLMNDEDEVLTVVEMKADEETNDETPNNPRYAN